MDVISALVAYSQPTKPIQPGKRALNYPAVFAQLLFAFYTTTRNTRHNARFLEMIAVGLTVITLVSVHFLGFPTRTPPLLGDGRQSVYHLSKQGGLMHIGGGYPSNERNTLFVRNEMPFRPRLAPVGGVFDRFAPPFGAGTEEASIQARDQSILSAMPSLSRRT